MKKKIVLMGVAAILVMTAIVGSTLAGFSTETEQQGITNISTKELGIALIGTDTADKVTEESRTAFVPGSEMAVPYCVKNNVTDGYDLYTRVTIYKTWNNDGDAKLDASKIHLYVTDDQGGKTELNQTGKLHNGWIVWYADDEQIVLYYTKPLAQGETTQNVLDGMSVDADINNDYAGASIELAFDADSVQKTAAEAAIPSEWGVYPKFDEAGNLTEIEE